MTVRPILNVVNHETNELFFDNLEIPAENLIGEEGMGFKYILTSLNAERNVCEGARRIRPTDTVPLHWKMQRLRRVHHSRSFPCGSTHYSRQASNDQPVSDILR